MASQAQFRGHGTASWERERSMHDSWWCVSANRLCGCLDQPVEAFENPRVTCYRLSRGGTWLRHMDRATAQVPEPRRVKSRIELATDLARPPIWALAVGTVARM